jgi:hypothetical protein
MGDDGANLLTAIEELFQAAVADRVVGEDDDAQRLAAHSQISWML